MGYPVSLGNFFLGEFLDGDGGDDEAGFVHGSIRAMVYSYVLRQGIPMSCNHTLSARQCHVARHRNTLNPRFQSIFLFLALVIACCVEGEVS